MTATRPEKRGSLLSPEEFLPPFLLVSAAALGLVVGSFLNVVIFRMPAGESIVHPRSRCPGCKGLIRWYDNIPVLSWLLLRAKCRTCSEPISGRYAVVELFTGAVFAVAAWALVVRHGLEGGIENPARVLHLLVGFGFLGSLIAASWIDLDHKILPDRITKRGMVLGPLCSGLLAPTMQPVGLLPDMTPHGAALILSMGGVLAGWGVIRIVAWAGEKAMGREAMGMGDSKFLGMIGGFVGPLAVLGTLVIASFLGSVIGIVVMAVKKDREIPFGPFLAVGAALLFVFPVEIPALLFSLLDQVNGLVFPR
ncbi:MAG: prepilin peptidase [Planctomycetota bacterium]